jgi:hypothetical protein
MKKLVLAVVAFAMAAPAMAQVYVNPYVKRDGTYVQGHYRSSPNSSVYDNYSTRGNTNPYTGQIGTRNPYGSTSRPGYSSPYSRPKPSSCTYSIYC